MFETVLLALVASLGLRFEAGCAGYYAPGVMRDVVNVRRAGWTANPLPEELPPVVGYIATPECERIGQLVWLFHESEGFGGPYLVGDCANHIEGHHVRMKERGIVCDIDYNTAARWRVLGFGPQDIKIALISLDTRQK